VPGGVAGRAGHGAPGRDATTRSESSTAFLPPIESQGNRQHVLSKVRRPARRRGNPSQLDGLRKKERLRELYGQHQPASGSYSLAALASVIGPQAGLDEDIARAWLTEFAAAN